MRDMGEPAVHEDLLTRRLRKVARLWSLVIIALGVLIFIMEILELLGSEAGRAQAYPWFENLIPLTLFTAVIGLGLAWRWEGLGAVIAILSLIINMGVYLMTGRDQVLAVMLILTPILIPGVLFLICWWRERG